MDNIYVESSSITAQLDAFKGEMTKLEALFARVDEEIAAAKTIWEGDASDATLAEIEKLNKLFDEVKKDNQKYVEFLNIVIEKYTDEDDTNIRTVASNEKAFDTTING